MGQHQIVLEKCVVLVGFCFLSQKVKPSTYCTNDITSKYDVIIGVLLNWPSPLIMMMMMMMVVGGSSVIIGWQ